MMVFDERSAQMMPFSASISNRFVAIVMAMLIPFCCCTLDLCAQSTDTGTIASCCCGPVDDSCPEEEHAPSGACLGCIKAPANPAPNIDTTTLSDMPEIHPALVATSLEGLPTGVLQWRTLTRYRHDPGNDPGNSARVLRCQLTPQV